MIEHTMNIRNGALIRRVIHAPTGFGKTVHMCDGSWAGGVVKLTTPPVCWLAPYPVSGSRCVRASYPRYPQYVVSALG
jgi:hypothetical protein